MQIAREGSQMKSDVSLLDSTSLRLSTGDILAGFVGQMPQGALMITGDGHVAYANEAFCQIVRKTFETISCRPIEQFVPEHDRERLACFLRDSRLGSSRDEFDLLITDNGLVAVQLTAFPLSAQSGLNL